MCKFDSLKRSSRLILTLVAAASFGCGKKTHFSGTGDVSGGQKAEEPSAYQGITTRPASTIECAAGGSVFSIFVDANRNGLYENAEVILTSQIVCNGTNGHDGADGTDGQNGADGQDGANGNDGQDANPSDYSIVDVILPCGETVQFKEVLLRLQNGRVLGSYSDNSSGSMTRFAFLPDGTFMNTDNSGCTFSLSTSPDGTTRSVSWFGQEQASWPVLY